MASMDLTANMLLFNVGTHLPLGFSFSTNIYYFIEMKVFYFLLHVVMEQTVAALSLAGHRNIED